MVKDRNWSVGLEWVKKGQKKGGEGGEKYFLTLH